MLKHSILKSFLFIFFFSLKSFCTVTEVSINLEEPSFKNGILSTEKGGILETTTIRIQAKYIRYTNQFVEGQQIIKVSAKENLMINNNGRLLVGDELEYDFQAKRGLLKNGKITYFQWFIGGESIEINPDKSYIIHKGFLTTNPDKKTNWKIAAQKIELSKDKNVHATQVKLIASNTAILGLPVFDSNVETLLDSPLSTNISWSNFRGSRLGLRYRFLATDHLQAYAHINYNLKKGPGGGLDFNYNNSEREIDFLARNNVLRDKSIYQSSDNKLRYRFMGKYEQKFAQPESKTLLRVQYDKTSDPDIANDLNLSNAFDLKSTNQSGLLMAHQRPTWTLVSRIDARLNNFETTQENIPSLEANFLPFQFGETGIFSENRAKLAYQDFKYSHSVKDKSDFYSAHFLLKNETYKTFKVNGLNFTPRLGFVANAYDNSPQKTSIFQGQYLAGLEANTLFSKNYPSVRHIITPYIAYSYFSPSITSLSKQYIFSLEDALTSFHHIKIGTRHSLFFDRKGKEATLISADLYLSSFHGSGNFNKPFSKLGLGLTYFPLPKLSLGSDLEWNIEKQKIDQINFRAGYTYNENLAFTGEILHRSSYKWRKANPYNFGLDTFKSNQELLGSPLSDQRTLSLLKVFYRLSPEWSCQLEARKGGRRKQENGFLETRLAFTKRMQSQLLLHFAIDHTENENRFSFKLSLDL